jgi:hypothetical protein
VKYWNRRRHARYRDRVVAAMLVRLAGLPLFFDVRDFAARRNLAVAPDDAAAAQGGESEQPDHTHSTTLTVGPPTEAWTLRRCLRFPRMAIWLERLAIFDPVIGKLQAEQ